MLNLLILIPLFTAFVVMLGAPARKMALTAAVMQTFFAVLALLKYDQQLGGFQLRSVGMISPDWDLKYLLAADGLSLVMLLLTALVTLAAIWVTTNVEKRPNLFYACLLFISAG